MILRPLFIDEHGFFGIKERAVGDKLTDLLVEKGLVKINYQNGIPEAVSASEETIAALLQDPEVKQISKEIEKLIELRKKYPHLISDLGPDNIFVTKKGLSLVDIGKSGPSTKAKFDAVKSFGDYVRTSEGLINRYIATGVIDVRDLKVSVAKAEGGKVLKFPSPEAQCVSSALNQLLSP